MKQHKVRVIYADGTEAEIFTGNEELAKQFFNAFCHNPEVREVTQSKAGKNGYRHVITATSDGTTLPVLWTGRNTWPGSAAITRARRARPGTSVMRKRTRSGIRRAGSQGAIH
jgi:hypothetical protein